MTINARVYLRVVSVEMCVDTGLVYAQVTYWTRHGGSPSMPLIYLVLAPVSLLRLSTLRCDSFTWSHLDPIINLVLLQSSTLHGSKSSDLLLAQFWLCYLGPQSSAFFLMSLPPAVAFTRRSIHASLDQAKERSLRSARSIALPYVCTIAVNLVMECMVDCDFVAAVIVDRICKQQESRAMACPVVATAMPPRSRDEEVGVYGFMK